mgnify:CR=1 FL=1
MTFATHQTIASAYHLCVAYKMLTCLDIFKIYCNLLLPLCKKKTDSIFSSCCWFFNFVLHVEGFHLRWCSLSRDFWVTICEHQRCRLAVESSVHCMVPASMPTGRSYFAMCSRRFNEESLVFNEDWSKIDRRFNEESSVLNEDWSKIKRRLAFFGLPLKCLLVFLKRRLIEDSTKIGRRFFGVKQRLIEDLTKIDRRFIGVKRRLTED